MKRILILLVSLAAAAPARVHAASIGLAAPPLMARWGQPIGVLLNTSFQSSAVAGMLSALRTPLSPELGILPRLEPLAVALEQSGYRPEDFEAVLRSGGKSAETAAQRAVALARVVASARASRLTSALAQQDGPGLAQAVADSWWMLQVHAPYLEGEAFRELADARAAGHARLALIRRMQVDRLVAGQLMDWGMPAEEARVDASLVASSPKPAARLKPAPKLDPVDPLSPLGAWPVPGPLRLGTPRQNKREAELVDRYVRDLSAHVSDRQLGASSVLAISNLQNVLDKAIGLVLRKQTGHDARWSRDLALNADTVRYRLARTQWRHQGDATLQAVAHLAARASNSGYPWWLRDQTLVNLAAVIDEFQADLNGHPQLRSVTRQALVSILGEEGVPPAAEETARAALAKLQPGK